MSATGSDDAAPSGGLYASLRRLAATGVGVVRTRLELLANDLEEERVRLGSALLHAAMGLFFFAMATVLFTMLIVVIFWDTHRILALVVLGVLFLVGGLYNWNVFTRNRTARPRFLSATLGELAKDSNELSSR